MGNSHRFNPRARAGRDGDDGYLQFFGKVSIHAPARGATSDKNTKLVHNGFQSTRPRGARHSFYDIIIGICTFQSTRPRGARPKIRYMDSWAIMFQSTRPRGARLGCQHGCPLSVCFNPRARAGRDVFPCPIVPPHLCFNPRARAGRDNRRRSTVNSYNTFQSTRPRGARHTT